MTESYLPKGYPHLIPYIAVKDAGAALDFYSRAFGATETNRIALENGAIMHAEMRIDESVFMFTTAQKDRCPSAGDLGGSPVSFVIYVPDCDTAYQIALDEGATSVEAPGDMFWGDRVATVQDPFGFKWMLNTKVEEVSNEEAQKRMRAMFAKPAA